MNWIDGIQNALDYIEDNITNELDYNKIAEVSYSSPYHFQRVFSIMCGYTLGEYIRNRRLSLAGSELASEKIKVIDVALKYGYENPDSFTKAFTKFHGITPSEARKPGAQLRSFARLSIKISLKGGTDMKYRIEEKEEMILTGYKRRFSGVPYGQERAEQEENFFITTRGKQWILRGACNDYTTDYTVVTNIDDDGYDFYIANPLETWTRENLLNQSVTGVDFMDTMGFENITIPKSLYLVTKTEESISPIGLYHDLRSKIVSEWSPNSNYQFADSPEVVLRHWETGENINKRYVELWIPLEKNI